MHDVAKRSLAVAVAAGGLLITGTAPALSVVANHHPEKPDTTPKGQAAEGDHAARAASIPVDRQRIVGQAAPEQAPIPAQAAREAYRQQAIDDAMKDLGAPADLRDGCVPAGPCTPLPPPPPPGCEPSEPCVAPPPPLGGPDEAGGILKDNTIEVPIQAPVNICGVFVAAAQVIRDQLGPDACHTAGLANETVDAATSGGSVASGNVVQVPIEVPVNVCGDSVSVIAAGNAANDILCSNDGFGGTFSHANAVTGDNPGIANGNVVQVPIEIPVNVCGDTVGVLGFGNTAVDDHCHNGSPVPAIPGGAGAAADAMTSDSPGLANANVVQLPVQIPVEVCGDSVYVAGIRDLTAGDMCADYTPGGSSAVAGAHGSDGVGTGNLVQIPVNVPAEACALTAALGGVKNEAVGDTCLNETGSTPAATVVGVTTDESGLITGNAVQGSANNPVELCGDTGGAALVGDVSTANECVTGPPIPCPPPTTTPPPPPTSSTPMPPPPPPTSSTPMPPPPPPTSSTPIYPPPPPPTTPTTSCPPTTMPPPPPPTSSTPIYPPPPPPTSSTPNMPPPPPPTSSTPNMPPPPPPTSSTPNMPPPPPPTSSTPNMPPPPPPTETTPRTPPVTTPPGTPPGLPHTGADVVGLAGLGAATLAAGAGVLVFTRRKSEH